MNALVDLGAQLNCIADAPAAKIEFDLQPIQDASSARFLWESLDVAGPHSFFVCWEWIGAWLRNLPERFTPHLLVATTGGRPVAAAVVISNRARRYGVLATHQLWLNETGDSAYDCVTIEHNGFAVLGPTVGRLHSALLDWFSKSGADELVLPGVRMENECPPGKFVCSQRTTPAFNCKDLQRLGEQGGYIGTLSRNSRQQLRRAMRACEEQGPLQLTVAQTPQTALDYFNELKKLHVHSWSRRGRPHAFANAFFETFHRDLIAHSVGEGGVQLIRIAAGAHTLGYLYNFRRHNRVYAYQSGFDDGTPALKPGYVSHLLAIDHYARQGATDYDFLAGANRLKQSLSNETYTMSWCRFSQPQFRFRTEHFLRSALGRGGPV